jgi:hypothetical protein
MLYAPCALLKFSAAQRLATNWNTNFNEFDEIIYSLGTIKKKYFAIKTQRTQSFKIN